MTDRAARGLLAIVGIGFAALALAASCDAGTPGAWRVAIALLALVAAVRPNAALLLAVVVVPIATPLVAATHAPFPPNVGIELILIAVIAGVSLRLSVAREPVPPSRLLWPATALAGVALGAGLLGVVFDQHGSLTRTQLTSALWTHLAHTYVSDAAGACSTVHVAMFWLEGLAMAVLIELVARRRLEAAPRLLRAFIVAGAAASVFPILRLAEVAMTRVDPWPAAWELLRTLRTSPLLPDVNAAGSYYALVLLPALWCALRIRGRWMWGPTLLIVCGLWLSGSRAAFVGVAVGAIAISLTSRKHVRWFAAIVIVLAVGAWLVTQSAGRYQASAKTALSVRVDLARIALQITERHPWFGAGLAQFPSASMRFVTPELVAGFPETAHGENAHNNYLQVLAELGIVGFAALVWAVLVPIAGALRESAASGDARLAAITGGLVALLTSALAGHPWLTPPVWIATAIAFGLAAGLRQAPDPRPFAARDAYAREAACVVLLIVAASLPARVSRALPHVEITHGQTPTFGP